VITAITVITLDSVSSGASSESESEAETPRNEPSMRAKGTDPVVNAAVDSTHGTRATRGSSDGVRAAHAHGTESALIQPVQPAAPSAERANVDLAAAARAIEAFLRALGHAPEGDPELTSTGRLVASAFHHELLAGYRMDPAKILAQSMPTQSRAMVVVRGIDVACMCPHHLLPSTGVVHVGYLPEDRIVGFGAIAQLARCYTRRLTLQESLCESIADALVEHLGAAAAGCVADLSPACLTCRGERPAQARVVSFATAGRMREDAALRSEFLALAGVNTEPNR
jgi:GTP cyclohydrolase I